MQAVPLPVRLMFLMVTFAASVRALVVRVWMKVSISVHQESMGFFNRSASGRWRPQRRRDHNRAVGVVAAGHLKDLVVGQIEQHRRSRRGRASRRLGHARDTAEGTHHAEG